MGELSREYGGTVHITQKKRNQFGGEIEVVRWMVQGKDLDAMMQRIYPFVRLKMRQASVMLLLRAMITMPGKRTEYFWEKAESLRREIRALNCKNGKGKPDDSATR